MADADKRQFLNNTRHWALAGSTEMVLGNSAATRVPKRAGQKKNLAIKKLRAGHRIFLCPMTFTAVTSRRFVLNGSILTEAVLTGGFYNAMPAPRKKGVPTVVRAINIGWW